MEVKMEVWPRGLYTLRVESVEFMHTVQGNNVYVVGLLHEDDGEYCYLYAADNEASRRAIWGDMVEEFHDMPQIEGRTFVFPIDEVVLWTSERGNRVYGPIAEVLDE